MTVKGYEEMNPQIKHWSKTYFGPAASRVLKNSDWDQVREATDLVVGIELMMVNAETIEDFAAILEIVKSHTERLAAHRDSIDPHLAPTVR